jgi:hypothetical protein
MATALIPRSHNVLCFATGIGQGEREMDINFSAEALYFPLLHRVMTDSVGHEDPYLFALKRVYDADGGGFAV